MNELYDILLPRPISPMFYDVLIFLFFVLHIFFVLLLLGTAFFVLLPTLQRNSSQQDLQEYSGLRSSMPLFFTAKSLAVNFGGRCVKDRVGRIRPVLNSENGILLVTLEQFALYRPFHNLCARNRTNNNRHLTRIIYSCEAFSVKKKNFAGKKAFCPEIHLHSRTGYPQSNKMPSG